MKKILFATTSDLATNPRLVKEIELALENSFEISVIYCRIKGWSSELTDEFIHRNRCINFIEVSATRNPFLPWLFSSLIERILSKINPKYLPFQLLAYSLNKRSILLNFKLKKIIASFDWVIAHNPGTFYPALKFSKKNGAKLGIDVEDYHPGESLNVHLNDRMELLMKRVLPQADYCSFAAPLIEKEVKTQITNKITKSFVVINGFNQFDFEYNESDRGILKMVWYSQNIDFGRGLEMIIPVVNEFKESIQLNLIGHLKPKFHRDMKLSLCQNIKIQSPLKQSDLHKYLTQFDVGLALETGKDRNNSLAISNKLISYVQSGLYVLSFATIAQEDFMLSNKLFGKVITNDYTEMKNCFLEMLELKKKNELKKREQFLIGQKLSWQNISKPLIQQWIE
jgi:glycosyltransferase involved in cell wall biosynthesis